LAFDNLIISLTALPELSAEFSKLLSWKTFEEKKFGSL
jgi:hypothetical protein